MLLQISPPLFELRHHNINIGRISRIWYLVGIVFLNPLGGTIFSNARPRGRSQIVNGVDQSIQGRGRRRGFGIE